MAMVCENNLPKYFWGEAINTAYMSLIGWPLDHCFQKLHMNFTKEENQMFHIWKVLVANVLY